MGAQRRRIASTPRCRWCLFDLPAKDGPKNGIGQGIDSLKKLNPGRWEQGTDAQFIEAAN